MKQREWMGYAAAVLAAGAFLAGCGNIRKLVKSDPEVGVHLPARSAQNPVAQAADTARTQKIITYRKQDGTELFITPVDVDSLSGEKMMSVAIDEVVISASNRRNLVERNGKINVEFVVSVPQELQARNWQLVVDPQLLKGADTLAFDPLVYSGDRFRTMQRREYARYDDYLGRIVDSADYFERFGDKRAYARYMDRVAEQRTKYADAEARLERMTPEEAMFDRQVGWTTRGERRRQYARLRRYVTATDRKVRERTSYTPDASDKFDHLNDYFAPRYRHAYTGDDVLPGGGELLLALVVVGDDHVDAALQGVVRLVDGGDAAVNGDDERDVARALEICDRVHVQAVALFDAVGDVRMHGHALPAQIVREHARGCDAVDVVVAEHGHVFPALDGGADACDGLVHVLQEHGVERALVAAAEKGARLHGVSVPAQGQQHRQQRRVARAQQCLRRLRRRVWNLPVAVFHKCNVPRIPKRYL